MRGGCICIPSEHERMNDLAGTVNRLNANWMFLTPTVAGLIQPSDVPTLKTLTLAGEAITQQNIDTWAGAVDLHVCYGPSECSIHASWHGHVGRAADVTNMGFGLSSLLWVVEKLDHHRLAAVGTIGELLIQGPLLGRGYLKDPARTAAAFITDPAWYAEHPLGHKTRDSRNEYTKRFYKTGDLVTMNTDGSICFVGRKDDQVKIYGQRTELGQIEHHLSSSSTIRHTCVTVPRKGWCDRRLVAILCLRDVFKSSTQFADMRLLPTNAVDSARGHIDDLTTSLWDELPRYMVPSLWIFVERLPFTTTGKIDRSKVRQWLEDMSEVDYRHAVDQLADRSTEAPTTEMERSIQLVWSAVLNLSSDQIQRNRPFFSLGGDSIAAMQVVAQCKHDGVSLSVQDILRHKTIAKLAQVSQIIHLPQTMSEIDVDGTAFELSPIQQWHIRQAPHGENHFNQSILLQLSIKTSANHVDDALAHLVGRHAMLRARFEMTQDGHWTQVVTNQIDSSYKFTSHSVETEGDLERALAVLQTSTDIRDGPLLIVGLFNDPSSEQQLLFLVAHHLVVDLVSWRILLRDLQDWLHSGTFSGHPSLPFQTWCRIQAQYCRSQLQYSETLPFEPTPQDLAFWRMDGVANCYCDVVKESFTLDATNTQLLLGESNIAFRTQTQDILLAVLLHSLQSTFPERDRHNVFVEGHGREPWSPEIDISSTVGWFTTIYPFQTQTQLGDSLINTLCSVKDTRHKIPGNGWPYFASNHLDGTRESTMEILFNYLGQYQQLEKDDSLLKQTTREICLPADINTRMARPALFEISAVILSGKLSITFAFSSRIPSQSRVLEWVKKCEQDLRELLPILKKTDAMFTPSDFPLIPFTYASLDHFMGALLQKGLTVDMIEDVYPCSPMQEGILLSQSKNPDHYRVSFTVEVIPPSHLGFVDLARLRTAWEIVVARHAALRTIIVESVCGVGLFTQIVLKRVELRVSISKAEAEDFVSKLWSQDVEGREQNLSPLRLDLLQTPTGKVLCRMSISHAFIDGTTLPLLLRDCCLAYNGKLDVTGPLYSDFIRHLGKRSKASEIDYWKGYLADAKPCHFPKLNELSQSSSGLLHSMTEEFDTEKILAVCQEYECSQSSLFRALWALILCTYTGMDDVSFGYLVSGRDAPVQGIQDAVGVFIGMLVCRSHMEGSNPLREVVQKVESDLLDALPHQYCPLAEIHHSLNLAQRTLFNTVMSFQNYTSLPDLDSSSITFRKDESRDPTEVSSCPISC